jgi:hypothetical protein
MTRTTRRAAFACLRTVLLVSFLAVPVVISAPEGAFAAPNTINQPDNGGQYTSIALDSSGFPVVSHYDAVAHELKVVHCGDAACSSGNTITAPDPTTMTVVGHTSLALAGDTPVVSHYDSGPRDLKLVHCGNAGCTSPTVRTLDSGMTDNVGIYASVAINSSGNPVVAYYTEPFDILKVLVCNNATCSSYSSQNVDPNAIRGPYPSLALDASGFPVVSYYDQSGGNLNVVHCGNATCSTGNTIVSPDGASADVGKYTSLKLDASGFPVISYYDETSANLKVIRCGDANCMSNNTIRTPDSTGAVGQYTSLALDGAGNPVVSYYSVTDSALKILHCGDATCTSGNTITLPDSSSSEGQYTSLVLDGAGFPVVSYRDGTGMLSVLHCGDPTCTGSPTSVGGLSELTGVIDRRGEGRSFAQTAALIAALATIALAGWELVRRRRPGS